MIRPHATTRRLRAAPDGRTTWAVGLRLGFWPCLKAPFIQVTLGHRIASFWVSSMAWDGVPPEAERFEATELGKAFSSAAERAAARHAHRVGA